MAASDKARPDAILLDVMMPFMDAASSRQRAVCRARRSGMVDAREKAMAAAVNELVAQRKVLRAMSPGSREVQRRQPAMMHDGGWLGMGGISRVRAGFREERGQQ